MGKQRGTPFFLYTLMQMKDSLTLCLCLFYVQSPAIYREMLPDNRGKTHDKHEERDGAQTDPLFTHNAMRNAPLGEPRLFKMANLISNNAL